MIVRGLDLNPSHWFCPIVSRSWFKFAITYRNISLLKTDKVCFVERFSASDGLKPFGAWTQFLLIIILGIYTSTYPIYMILTSHIKAVRIPLEPNAGSVFLRWKSTVKIQKSRKGVVWCRTRDSLGHVSQ